MDYTEAATIRETERQEQLAASAHARGEHDVHPDELCWVCDREDER